MKTIKKLTAILSCIAVAGSLATTPAFAAEQNTETVTIEAMANACGWDNTASLNTDRCATYDYLRLGGTDKDNVIFNPSTSRYPITDGADILYNAQTTKRDANVIYLRFNLPEDASETDIYKLSITSIGATNNRPGDLEVYAGVVDVEKTVISGNAAPGKNWKTRALNTTEGGITWNTRPVVNSITKLGTISATSTSTNTWDISSILREQTDRNVTIALMGKLVKKMKRVILLMQRVSMIRMLH